MEIGISEGVMKKYLDTIIPFKTLKWYSKIYYYTIDSKYRTSIAVNKFIKNQLINPDPEVKELAVDLRVFNEHNLDTDKTIINILNWVVKNIKYEHDKVNFGKVEYWATAEETLHYGKDDCDGINGLIYVLARLAGIPRYVLFNIIGSVVGGGHYYCVYYSFEHSKLTAIDGTYYPDKRSVKYRPEFSLNDKKYKTIWCLFSDKYSFVTR